MSFYAQINQEGRVVAIAEAESNPNEDIWLESPWSDPPDDFDDWLYVGGEFSYDPRDLPPTPYSPEQVLSALLSETDVMDSLPDSALEHMAPYMAEWEAGKPYTVGDKVQHDDRPYRCEQAHTSQEGWEPPNAPALWTRIGKPGEVPEWVQPTGAQDAYDLGDHVMHGGREWVSTYDGKNVWEPGVFGWEPWGGE